MKNWWQSYQSKSSKKHRDPSIAKDEVALLAERLEFFVPKLRNKTVWLEVLAYMVAWVLFVSGLKMDTYHSWDEAMVYTLVHLIILMLIVFPSVFLLKVQRESLKNLNVFNASLRIVINTSLIAALSIFGVLFITKSLGLLQLSFQDIVGKTIQQIFNVAGFTSVFLIYCYRQYKRLQALQHAFEQRMITQNEHIKARLEPHSLFNTINTLISLIEVDNQKEEAAKMLQHVSQLFRVSLLDPKEANFEDEIELCEHYFAIERYRLQDKLMVTWDLPDEDLIYDMSITSLTLLHVLEKIVLHVVGMTTETVTINIKVRWENNTVTITVLAELPAFIDINESDVQSNLEFNIQELFLRQHFGKSANIATYIESNRLMTVIGYPLYDVLI